MLLGADYKNAEGKDCVEPLEAPWAAPGTKVILSGSNENAQKKSEISGDEFFKVNIKVVNKKVQVAGVSLIAAGKEITTVHTENAKIK